MSSFDIKVVAIITMIIDHIGLFFFPQFLLLRVIGRLSFPLFAWLIANGAHHTHNINKYLFRIVTFAFISQVPFILANHTINPSFWYLNVLFTLFLGLVAIKTIKQTRKKWITLLVIMLCIGLGQFLKTDYGASGVLSVIAFYLFFYNKKLTFISQFLIFILPLFVQILWQAMHHLLLSPYILAYIEPLSLFSLIFIYSYNHQEGYKTKYLFYYFYPLQYCLIFLLKIYF